MVMDEIFGEAHNNKEEIIAWKSRQDITSLIDKSKPVHCNRPAEFIVVLC